MRNPKRLRIFYINFEKLFSTIYSAQNIHISPIRLIIFNIKIFGGYMKKFFKAIIPFTIVASIIVACVGCTQPKKTTLELLADRTSYMQNSMYTANDENFDVTLSVITQEEHFIADGKTENVMEISTLVLTPHNVDLLSNTYEYTLTGSQSSVSGSISKNRLGINLACKINDISTLGDLQKLTLTLGENSIEYELTDICPEEVDGSGALEIAYNHYQQKIDAAFESKTFDRECYVKLITQTEEEGKYYWYVSFIKDKGDYWAAVVDPQTKEVVNARESKPE